MTRRRVLRLGSVAAVAALAVAVWALWPPGTAITRGNAAEIRVGMSLEEVEAILGGPARDETRAQFGVISPDDTDWLTGEGVIVDWTSDECCIQICFRAQRVTRLRVLAVAPWDESVLGMFRRLLHL